MEWLTELLNGNLSISEMLGTLSALFGGSALVAIGLAITYAKKTIENLKDVADSLTNHMSEKLLETSKKIEESNKKVNTFLVSLLSKTDLSASELKNMLLTIDSDVISEEVKDCIQEKIEEVTKLEASIKADKMTTLSELESLKNEEL